MKEKHGFTPDFGGGDGDLLRSDNEDSVPESGEMAPVILEEPFENLGRYLAGAELENDPGLLFVLSMFNQANGEEGMRLLVSRMGKEGGASGVLTFKKLEGDDKVGGKIEEVYVLPAYRGRDLARQMVQKALDLMEGQVSIWVESPEMWRSIGKIKNDRLEVTKGLFISLMEAIDGTFTGRS